LRVAYPRTGRASRVRFAYPGYEGGFSGWRAVLPRAVPLQRVDIEYGRCFGSVAQALFGCACMVKRNSPPAMMSS